MTSPHLAIAHVAAAQNQKEVTINDAVDALDNAMNRALVVAMADGDLTLTAGDTQRNGLIVLTGTLTAPRTVTLPALHRRLALRNATDGGFALTAGYPGGGASVAVPPETTALLHGDGTDLYGVAGGGGASELATLTDVDVAGAMNGDLLRFDGALWRGTGAGIVQRAMLPFRGALVQRSTDMTSVLGPLFIPWQAAVYDTDGFWTAGSPERLTVPAGVTKIRLFGALALKPSTTYGGVYLNFDINGLGDVAGCAPYSARQYTSGYVNNDFATFSAALPVQAGDYVQLRVNFNTANWNSIIAGARTWFALEVVETEDAADPPADVSFAKAGTLDASEVLLRTVIVRRTRLVVDLAGSQGRAGVAATAETDFDVRRNGISIGTIRFAVGSTSAVFIAASETVVEPGDLLEAIAPATADATLADIAVTLAGSLVV
jgi:hypothetical protein